jgi:hypothetical protein
MSARSIPYIIITLNYGDHMQLKILLFSCLAVLALWERAYSATECRKVERIAGIDLDPAALSQLKDIGITEDGIFGALKDLSVPETRGCWGGATGSFDGELLSAGAVQWNFGQKTLQVLLIRFRDKITRGSTLNAEMNTFMPKYGTKFLSQGCTRAPVTKDCEDFLKSVQSGKGRLNTDFKSEVDALFESNIMIQIQTDVFVTLLTGVISDLKRLFPGGVSNLKQIKWAIDTKVQQGGFPGNEDIARVRKRYTQLDFTKRRNNLLNILQWYSGLCRSIDQDGVSLDCDFNIPLWQNAIQNNGVSDSQADLLLLSHLRSRIAAKESGLYQALTFQRRAKIIFGFGSVHGRKDGV